MSALRDFLLAPGDGGSGARRVVAATPGRAVPASLGVLAPAAVLPTVAAAVGVVLARRAGAPRSLVCLYAAGAPAPAPCGDRLVASLAARDVGATRRGRVVVVGLPADADDAVATARRAGGAAGGAPLVLGVALRVRPLDELLAEQDALLLAAGPDAAPAQGLALASARTLALRVVPLPAALTPPARGLALAGVAAPRIVRHAVDEALG